MQVSQSFRKKNEGYDRYSLPSGRFSNISSLLLDYLYSCILKIIEFFIQNVDSTLVFAIFFVVHTGTE